MAVEAEPVRLVVFRLLVDGPVLRAGGGVTAALTQELDGGGAVREAALGGEVGAVPQLVHRDGVGPGIPHLLLLLGLEDGVGHEGGGPHGGGAAHVHQGTAAAVATVVLYGTLVHGAAGVVEDTDVHILLALHGHGGVGHGLGPDGGGGDAHHRDSGVAGVGGVGAALLTPLDEGVAQGHEKDHEGQDSEGSHVTLLCTDKGRSSGGLIPTTPPTTLVGRVSHAPTRTRACACACYPCRRRARTCELLPWRTPAPWSVRASRSSC